MENKMKMAHEWAREIKNKYPDVDYKIQFGLCLSTLYQKENKEDEKESDWDKLDKALDKCIKEEFKNEDGWYCDWYADVWEKYGKKRTYFKIKTFRKGKHRGEINCGYWDHVEEKYVAESRYSKVLNVIDYYNGADYKDCYK